MDQYINTLRSMADEIDSDYSRGKMFIRVTELKPFSVDMRKELVKLCTNMIDQISILHNIPNSSLQRLTIITRLYSTLMEYPEFVASFVSLRNMTEKKCNEFLEDIKNKDLPRSQILEDYQYYLSMLQKRPDYVDSNVFPHNFNTPCTSTSISQPKPTHNYYLRSCKA